jgi:hypothetical protein
MRAFMSTGDSHLRLPYPSEGLARHYAEHAVREARAILAATEPDTPIEWPVRAWAERSLADALRAFVEEELSASESVYHSGGYR